MGMTDGQFKSYIRMVIERVEAAKGEAVGNEKAVEVLEKLLENLKAALES